MKLPEASKSACQFDFRGLPYERLEDLREQVFVVELDEPVEAPDSVQVLRSEAGEATTHWIRDITGSLQGTTLPGEIRRRNVGLEEIYLARVRLR